MKYIKHVVSIDISMDTLVVRFGSLTDTQEKMHSPSVSFPNARKGFSKLMEWAKQQRGTSTAPLIFMMEATGSYYEPLAYYLHGKGCSVSVLLPTKIKHYAKSLDTKSKTDSLDTIAMVLFALERSLTLWQPPSPVMNSIKFLLRERQSFVKTRTQMQNKRHAKDHSYKPDKETKRRMKETVRFYSVKIKEIEEQVKLLISMDPYIQERVRNCTTVKGVGWLTVMTVVAETDGFILIKSGKQLTSYVGYDVVHNESGKKSRKTKISKKGNSHIRGGLFMPALSACSTNPKMKALYERLFNKTNIPYIGVIAVARKLLLLIYTLWTKNEPYDPNYGNTSVAV
jgi:transposase